MIPLRKIVKAATDEVTDDTIAKMEKAAKLIRRRDVKVTLVETSGVDLDGVAQWDKTGNFRFMAKAGGIIPISGIPIDASADGGTGSEFQLAGEMDVKISIESMVRVEPKGE